jgi:hypothetical protein
MRRLVWVCLLAAVMACGEAAPPTSPSATAAEAALSRIEVDPSVLSGQAAWATVTLTSAAPANGVAISLTTSGASATVPPSVTVPSGATSATFEVTTTRVVVTTDIIITARAGDVTRTAPLRLRLDPAGLRPSTNYTIGFAGLRDNRAAVPTYTESGFTISAVSADWMAITSFGNPLPSLQFMSAPGVTTTGEIRITAGGAPFWLVSADYYSSTTRIPYVIEGTLSSQPMFTVLNVLGNTFGSFVRVANPNVDAAVDALLIRLSNPAAPCCGNPMGIDNIVLNR